MKIKNGDIVGRKSYNKDIFFIVKDMQNKNNVILEGYFKRIIADSNIDDLVLIDKFDLLKKEKLEEKYYKKEETRLYTKAINGKILHLDAVNDIL